MTSSTMRNNRKSLARKEDVPPRPPDRNETAGALAGAAGGDNKAHKVVAAIPYQNRRARATAKPAEGVDYTLYDGREMLGRLRSEQDRVAATDADDRPLGLFDDVWSAERAIFAARRAAGAAP